MMKKLIIKPIANLKLSRSWAIYGRSGTGKAQPLKSKILTPSGWITMGDAKVGMPICGMDGKTYRIAGVFPQGIRPAYRLTLQDGTFVECDLEHLWKVSNRNKHYRDGWLIRTTAQLMNIGNPRKRVFRNYRLPLPQAVEFVAEPLPLPPYILGVLIGDGYLNGTTIVFSVSPAKKQIKKKVLSLLGDEYTLSGPSGEKSSSPQWRIVGGAYGVSSMPSIMKSLGLNIKSHQRFIPPVYMQASIADRLELLRGLMDTNGTSRNGRTSFTTCSEQLASDVADLVRSLGGIAISHYQQRKDGKPDEWSVNVRLNECPFSLDYKAAHWRRPALFYGKRIVSIEYIGDIEQQCITTTAPDQMYVTDGYNPTHNSTFASTFPKPMLLVDVQDMGTDSIRDVKGIDVVSLTEWEEIDAVYDLLTSSNKYKSVCIDTMTQLQLLCANWVRKKARKPELHGIKWGDLTQQEWGNIGAAMKQKITEFRDLDMEVCFIAQERTSNVIDDDTTVEVLLPEVGAALSPATASHLNASVSIIANTFIRIKRRKREKSKAEIITPIYSMRIGPNPIYTTKVRKPKNVDLPDLIDDPDYETVVEIIEGR